MTSTDCLADKTNEPMSNSKKKNRNKKQAGDEITLTLTKRELAHVRDMMSIVLPHDHEQTISATLADYQMVSDEEQQLWKKIVKACTKSGVEIDSAAPDYVLMLVEQPVLSVFKLENSLSSEDPGE